MKNKPVHKKKVFFNIILLVCIFISSNTYSQETQQIHQQRTITDLTIMPNDIRLESTEEGGWNLFIRKKSGLNSVLLVETTRGNDPNATNYTYRAEKYNETNGNEIRLLNGEILDSAYSQYSLVDSTPQKDSEFEEAFQIYIPSKILFGYPWSRSGEVEVGMGTFVNIRGFEKEFADYTGNFEDNPYMFTFVAPPKKEKSEPLLTDIYNEKAVDAFDEIANGMLVYSKGPETIVEDVMKAFNELPKDTLVDVVFAIDATGSMWDDIARLQKELVPSLTENLKERVDVQLGLLYYRDFTDNFKYANLPVQIMQFTKDPNRFFAKLNTMKIPKGTGIGGDIPEAVYEALYASMKYFNWRKDSEKKIILIGDAEPHESPRGLYGVSKETVVKMSSNMNITIDAIITPDKQH